MVKRTLNVLLDEIKSSSIVHIDDETTALKQWELGLRKNVGEIHSFNDPADGINYIVENISKIPPQVLLLDLHMDTKPGWLVLYELAQAGIVLPTVMLSGEQGNDQFSELADDLTKVTSKVFGDFLTNHNEVYLGEPFIYLKKENSRPQDVLNAIAVVKYRFEENLGNISKICDILKNKLSQRAKKFTAKQNDTYDNSIIGMYETRVSMVNLSHQIIDVMNQFFNRHGKLKFLNYELCSTKDFNEMGKIIDKKVEGEPWNTLAHEYLYVSSSLRNLYEFNQKYDLKWLKNIDPEKRDDIKTLQSVRHRFNNIAPMIRIAMDSMIEVLEESMPEDPFLSEIIEYRESFVASNVLYDKHREGTKITKEKRTISMNSVLHLLPMKNLIANPITYNVEGEIRFRSGNRSYQRVYDNILLMLSNIIENGHYAIRNQKDGELVIGYHPVDNKEVPQLDGPGTIPINWSRYRGVKNVFKFSFMNNGGGIEEAALEGNEIFSRNYSTKPEGGRGLSIVDNIARRYGFGIEIKTEPLTTVNVYIPCGTMKVSR